MAKTARAETPMMVQHREIKSRYPDAILLFRVGDFYETFGADAVTAARILGITLTKRSNGAAHSVELAGFPHHALDTYLHKLVKAGHRVAICDQLEDPKEAKGVVKRGVTELVTPGVATNDKLLEHKTNNFLAAVHFQNEVLGLSFLDISTGEAFAAQGDADYADKLLQSFAPSEILLSKGTLKRFRERFGTDHYTFALEDWVFAEGYGYETCLAHFGTQSLKGFGLDDQRSAVTAVGAALHYLRDTEHPHLQHITGVQRVVADQFLWMDRFTVRNLELFGTNEGGASLLGAIDHTCTPMGARLLRRWIQFPLFDGAAIARRHDLVEYFLRDGPLQTKLLTHLKAVGDIERLVSKVPLRKASPREVQALARGLQQMELVQALCEGSGYEPLARAARDVQPCADLQRRIRATLLDEVPAVIGKGALIREGVHADLDELRAVSKGGKNFLLQLQQKEAARTGISSLKVAYNNVFGYYLEVTHAHKDKVPAEWIRKQTLTTAERYVTPELKEWEEKILGAEERMHSLETGLFAELLAAVEPFIACIQANAAIIASLDCLISFAQVAQRWNYRRPEVVAEPVLELTGSRHPVIEQRLPPGEPYVPNDLRLDKETQQIILLTGPNMSGKSAVLRQTALITLLAHIGSFVPCERAVIGLTDKIFTRVGASDNLSGGESTFMVEMNETASIVNNLSERSLVLLDEIGRGTSTYDGISIAWSLVEHLHNHPAKPKALFATHYHELAELEKQLPRVKNYHITHRESGNRVIFLRTLAPGGSRHSFGIQVARMAGMPPALVGRAEEVLAQLEEKGGGETEAGRGLKRIAKTVHFQLNIFDGLAEDLRRVQQVLTGTDINTLTPVEALLKLNELKGMVERYG